MAGQNAIQFQMIELRRFRGVKSQAFPLRVLDCLE
jgi:hypothetical protein